MLARILAVLVALVVPACKRSTTHADDVASTRRYAADGIAFEYPEAMEIERGRKDVPLRVVIVRSDRAFAVVGWTPRAVDVAQLRERAYAFARNGVLRGTTIDAGRSGAAVSRTIGGRTTAGVLVYGRGESATLVGEVYALDVANSSVMLLLFYPERPNLRDTAMLEVIARSLGPDAERTTH